MPKDVIRLKKAPIPLLQRPPSTLRAESKTPFVVDLTGEDNSTSTTIQASRAVTKKFFLSNGHMHLTPALYTTVKHQLA